MQQVRQPVYQLEGVVHVVEVIATWSHGPVRGEGIQARLSGALCVLHTEATQSNNKPQVHLADSAAIIGTCATCRVEKAVGSTGGTSTV